MLGLGHWNKLKTTSRGRIWIAALLRHIRRRFQVPPSSALVCACSGYHRLWAPEGLHSRPPSINHPRPRCALTSFTRLPHQPLPFRSSDLRSPTPLSYDVLYTTTASRLSPSSSPPPCYLLSATRSTSAYVLCLKVYLFLTLFFTKIITSTDLAMVLRLDARLIEYLV